MCRNLIRISLILTTACFPLLANSGCDSQPTGTTQAQASYLFCFWNVENFFDDQNDHHENKADKEYDTWFSRDPQALHLKLAHLCDALLKMNDGKGPDILAIAEVESVRAAELLQEAFNQRVPDPALRYTSVLMKEISAGRHIAPAILTRLPVDKSRTHLLGKHLRILEGHIEVNGHDLVVLASHWTSRLTDKNGDRRDKYADQLHGAFYGMYKNNPNVDVLICGDFNDPPEAPSVTEHLRATGDQRAVVSSGAQPLLLDLMANKDAGAGFGTIYYQSKWSIFDHIVVSPGMLDHAGWSCDPDSVYTVNTLTRPGDKQHRPWRFGGEHDKQAHGYSDHFPVTAQLQVN